MQCIQADNCFAKCTVQTSTLHQLPVLAVLSSTEPLRLNHNASQSPPASHETSVLLIFSKSALKCIEVECKICFLKSLLFCFTTFHQSINPRLNITNRNFKLSYFIKSSAYRSKDKKKP